MQNACNEGRFAEQINIGRGKWEPDSHAATPLSPECGQYAGTSRSRQNRSSAWMHPGVLFG